jgi:beta-lactam-binding protein with PASTA domain
VSRFKTGLSAFGKLLTLAVLAGGFLLGFGVTLLVSLRGEEVKVPEIVGKDFAQSQDELESLGLRIKKRADRYSEEPPNTVLEQLPKPGETVKTGQMILVVTSKATAEGEEKPATIKKGDEKDDSETIEELISEKPKKKSNANSAANVNGSANSQPDKGDSKNGNRPAEPAETKPSEQNERRAQDAEGASGNRREARPSPTPSGTPRSSNVRPTPRPGASPQRSPR